jgi:hypothetical protein
MSSLEWGRDGMSIDRVVSAQDAGYAVSDELAVAAEVDDFDIVSSDVRGRNAGG